MTNSNIDPLKSEIKQAMKREADGEKISKKKKKKKKKKLPILFNVNYYQMRTRNEHASVIKSSMALLRVVGSIHCTVESTTRNAATFKPTDSSIAPKTRDGIDVY